MCKVCWRNLRNTEMKDQHTGKEQGTADYPYTWVSLASSPLTREVYGRAESEVLPAVKDDTRRCTQGRKLVEVSAGQIHFSHADFPHTM